MKLSRGTKLFLILFFLITFIFITIYISMPEILKSLMTSNLSFRKDYSVEIGKVSGDYFNFIVLENILVENRKTGQKVFSLKKLRLEYKLWHILKRELRIKKVLIDSVYINLYRTDSGRLIGNELLNIKPHQDKKGIQISKKQNFLITVNHAVIKNSTFILDDKETFLHFKNINFEGNGGNSKLARDVFKINISDCDANLYIRSKNAVYPNIIARDTRGQLMLLPDVIIWQDVSGRTETGEYLCSGRVLPREEKYFIQVDTPGLDLSELDKIFIHQDQEQLSGNFRGSVRIYGKAEDFHLSGLGESEEVKIYGQILKEIKTGVNINTSFMEFNVSEAIWNKARVSGVFKLNLPDADFSINGHGTGIDPAAIFPDMNLPENKFDLSSDFEIGYTPSPGEGGDDKLFGTLNSISGSAYGYDLTSAGFKFEKLGDDLSFPEIRVVGSGFDVTGTGKVMLGENPELNFTVTKGRVVSESFIRGVSGEVNLTGKFSGPLNEIKGNIALDSNRIEFQEFYFVNMKLESDFNYNGQFPTGIDLQGELTGSELKHNYSFIDEPKQIKISYTLSSGNLSFKKFSCKLLKTDVNVLGVVSGIFTNSTDANLNIVFNNAEYYSALGEKMPPLEVKSSGGITITGWVNDYNLGGNLILENIKLGRYQLEPLIANFNLTKDRFNLKMNAETGTFYLDSNFVISEKDIPFEFDLKVSRVSTQMLLELMHNPIFKDLSGKFRMDLTGSGTLVSPVFRGDFSTNIYNTIKNVELGILTGEMEYGNELLEFSNVELKHELYSINFEGSLPFMATFKPMDLRFLEEGDMQGRINLDSVSMDTANYLIKYLPFMSRKFKEADFLEKVEGILSGNLFMTGAVSNPDISGELRLKDGRIKSELTAEQKGKLFFINYKKDVLQLSFDMRDVNATIFINPLGDGRNRVNLSSFSGRFISSTYEGGFILNGTVDLENFKPEQFDLNFQQTSGIIPIILPNADVNIENSILNFQKYEDDKLPTISGELTLVGSKTDYDLIGIQDIFSIIYDVGVDLWEILLKEEIEKPSLEKLSLDVKNDMNVDLVLRVKDSLKFTGAQQNFFINTEQLRITGTLNSFALIGDVDIRGGKIFKWGHTFTLKKGAIKFDSADKVDPMIDLLMTARIQEYLVEIKVTGRKSNPRIELSSIPALETSQIFALLFIHQTPEFLKDPEKFDRAVVENLLEEQIITQAINAFTGKYTPVLDRFFDVKRISIESGEDSLRENQLYRATLGKYITQRMFLSYSSYIRNPRDPSLSLNIHVNSFMLFKSEINLSNNPERNIGDSIGIEVYRTVDYNKYLFKMFRLKTKMVEDEETRQE